MRREISGAAVNTNQNGVYLECFMEELARASGKDSLPSVKR
jgi:hypothetical protein